MSKSYDVSDLADELEDNVVFPEVPSGPIFPSVPSGPIMPVAPKLSSKERETLVSQRSKKFDEYVGLLRDTLNICIRSCGLTSRNERVRQNMSRINELVTDINTIDRNVNGGRKKTKRQRRVRKAMSRRRL
jgi:hypothetical protein